MGHGDLSRLRTATGWSHILEGWAVWLLCIGVAGVPVLFLPTAQDVFVDPKLAVVRAISVAAGISAAGSIILGRRRLQAVLTDAALATFVLVAAISTALSIDVSTSVVGEPLQRAGLISTAAIALGYAVARTTVMDRVRLRRLLVSVAVGASVVAVFGALQWAGLDPWWDELPSGRTFSSIGQPNWLGAYLVVTIPLTIAAAGMSVHRVPRVVLGLSVLTQAAVLITTLSRASWIGATCAALTAGVIIVVHRRRAGLSMSRFSAAVIVVAIAMLAVSSIAVWNTDPMRRARSTFDLGAFDIRQHLALWQVSGSIISDHPLIGTGPDTYAIVFPDYRDDVIDPYYAEYLSRFRPESPHNVYLAVAGGSGIAAVGALLIAVTSAGVIVVRASLSRPEIDAALVAVAACIAGHAVTDVFMTIDVATSWVWWAVLGAAIAYASGSVQDASARVVTDQRTTDSGGDPPTLRSAL